jgi:hypothetical protein
MDIKQYSRDSNAISIGHFAVELLAFPGTGRVMGVTSKGFFILTKSDRVLFISTDLLFGPIHIVINVLPEEVKVRLMGAMVNYSPDELFFNNLSFRIDLENGKVWQPQALPIEIQSAPEREHQINLIMDALVQSGRGSTFLPLLIPMVSRNNEPVSSDDWLNQSKYTIVDLRQAVCENKPGEAAKLMDPWLGYGPGLTPSGDDFIWGFLAALNRWKAVVCPQFEVEPLNISILYQAQKNTSSLSATLIECAAHGWADEKMLSVLDNLFTGEESVTETVEKVLSYGSSSGVDAFAGMVTAIQTCTYLLSR